MGQISMHLYELSSLLGLCPGETMSLETNQTQVSENVAQNWFTRPNACCRVHQPANWQHHTIQHLRPLRYHVGI
jgi:hypothetical protein